MFQMRCKKLILLLLLSISAFAYDFGDIPKVNVVDIPKGKPLMVQFGKTECIWCEHMAPYLKEIKEKYPKTPIYYINTDKDILGGINSNVQVLPTSVFWNEEGKEIGRHEGYLLPEEIMELLEKYGVLVKE
ncbi:MAG: Thioredoxin [uncultured Sulfurovum sp.]|uniref:Thioredoxin n=1 Tax=uncultured Sulfurovum sp. TaxID=269237 RepID=A0A6S6S8G3_9BACT|nr:MAG: Thioredoxin [uncultured Sulfurovum sp.]